jgi:hypothetical protein
LLRRAHGCDDIPAIRSLTKYLDALFEEETSMDRYAEWIDYVSRYSFRILMSVSIFTPKAFSMRSAISPDRSAFALSKLDRAGRET